MAKLIYAAIASLDGYVEDAQGGVPRGEIQRRDAVLPSCRREQVVGRAQLPVAVPDAHQRLVADHRVVAQVHDRLEHRTQVELVHRSEPCRAAARAHRAIQPERVPERQGCA
jgi:hypothetical protein